VPDDEVENLALDAIEGSLEFGWDREFGGLYNFMDIESLVALGKPWDTSATSTSHKLSASGTEGVSRFFKNIQSDKIVTASRPFNADKFILISAGYDGEYGTADDVCNFDWKYQE